MNTWIKTLVLAILVTQMAAPIYAQSGEIAQIQNFLSTIIEMLVLLSGSLATVFFVWGGVRYITSSGNPETLESAKKTIVYAALGLTISLSAFVLTTIVTNVATQSFGG